MTRFSRRTLLMAGAAIALQDIGIQAIDAQPGHRIGVERRRQRPASFRRVDHHDGRDQAEAGNPAVWVVDPATMAVALRTIGVERFTPSSVVVLDGLAVDTDLRWTLLRRLVSRGVLGEAGEQRLARALVGVHLA